MQRSFQEAGADEFKQRHPIIITLSAQSRVQAGEGEGNQRHNYLNFIQGTHWGLEFYREVGSVLSFLPITDVLVYSC